MGERNGSFRFSFLDRGRLHIPWNDQVQAECRARIEQSGHLTR